MIRAPISRMFRQVDISDVSSSRIYLHSMPGMNEPLETFREEMWRCGITRIICLAPLADVEDYSWSYGQAIKKNADSWTYNLFKIPDFGIPNDRDSYLTFITVIAGFILHPSSTKPDGDAARPWSNAWIIPSIDHPDEIQEHILIHCMAGVGRSGTFAIILLLVLGYSREEAERRVKKIGSGPESPKQKHLIDWCESELQRREKAEVIQYDTV